MTEGEKKIKLHNNNYEADYIEESDFSPAVAGGSILSYKKRKLSKYKGGMVSELSPAPVKGFAGCANWVSSGGKKRKSRKLRRKSYKGGKDGSKFQGHVSYTNNLGEDEEGYFSGGRRRRRKTMKRKSRKSRRH
jgi:hypothetical protein